MQQELGALQQRCAGYEARIVDLEALAARLDRQASAQPGSGGSTRPGTSQQLTLGGRAAALLASLGGEQEGAAAAGDAAEASGHGQGAAPAPASQLAEQPVAAAGSTASSCSTTQLLPGADSEASQHAGFALAASQQAALPAGDCSVLALAPQQLALAAMRVQEAALPASTTAVPAAQSSNTADAAAAVGAAPTTAPTLVVQPTAADEAGGSSAAGLLSEPAGLAAEVPGACSQQQEQQEQPQTAGSIEGPMGAAAQTEQRAETYAAVHVGQAGGARAADSTGAGALADAASAPAGLPAAAPPVLAPPRRGSLEEQRSSSSHPRVTAPDGEEMGGDGAGGAPPDGRRACSEPSSPAAALARSIFSSGMSLLFGAGQGAGGAATPHGPMEAGQPPQQPSSP